MRFCSETCWRGGLGGGMPLILSSHPLTLWKKWWPFCVRLQTSSENQKFALATGVSWESNRKTVSYILIQSFGEYILRSWVPFPLYPHPCTILNIRHYREIKSVQYRKLERKEITHNLDFQGYSCFPI